MIQLINLEILFQKGWGLQLLHNDEWFNVAPQKDAIICNVGDTLVKLTNGRVKVNQFITFFILSHSKTIKVTHTVLHRRICFL